jgi:hypothetical protein
LPAVPIEYISSIFTSVPPSVILSQSEIIRNERIYYNRVASEYCHYAGF